MLLVFATDCEQPPQSYHTQFSAAVAIHVVVGPAWYMNIGYRPYEQLSSSDLWVPFRRCVARRIRIISSVDPKQQ